VLLQVTANPWHLPAKRNPDLLFPAHFADCVFRVNLVRFIHVLFTGAGNDFHLLQCLLVAFIILKLSRSGNTLDQGKICPARGTLSLLKV
jgi:hypothetical protein